MYKKVLEQIEKVTFPIDLPVPILTERKQ